MTAPDDTPRENGTPPAPESPADRRDAAPDTPENPPAPRLPATAAPADRRDAAPTTPGGPADQRDPAPAAPDGLAGPRDAAPTAPDGLTDRRDAAPVTPEGPTDTRLPAATPDGPAGRRDPAPAAPEGPAGPRDAAPAAPRDPRIPVPVADAVPPLPPRPSAAPPTPGPVPDTAGAAAAAATADGAGAGRGGSPAPVPAPRPRPGDLAPLLPADPSGIAGYRLLGRLGAGGMGVVYLGRTDAGELAAVKVTLADRAERADFRARFRREVEAARRVVSPWAVPVLGADPDAPEPWLATAFVPGPSLGEAIAAHGPLPGRSLRVLGGAVARALAAVHAAGLVHRDVKPGNVLLAVDGPRLIDFGIARAADPDGETALTGTDMVVGTPGFLAPEQAEARTGAIGPASDVFAFGCLLAYAATGRPPFGTGAVDALMYRTVHDEPDLAGVPAGLLPLLRECLAKDPAARPTAEQLAARLVVDTPGTAADSEAAIATQGRSVGINPSRSDKIAAATVGGALAGAAIAGVPAAAVGAVGGGLIGAGIGAGVGT
ncbi:protein kinase, partial [Streptomyces roseolus]|uniref:serine/threonine-protein kinase n=1 Tax=Streptomyces roseolus TaxID=67358 RepID=UPI00364FDFE5